jgi:hypothetical protein
MQITIVFSPPEDRASNSHEWIFDERHRFFVDLVRAGEQCDLFGTQPALGIAGNAHKPRPER